MHMPKAAHWLYNPGSTRIAADDRGERLQPGRFYIMRTDWRPGSPAATRRIAAGPALTAEQAWAMLEGPNRAASAA